MSTWRTILAGILGIATLIIILLTFPFVRDAIWSVIVADVIVIAAILLVAFVLWRTWRRAGQSETSLFSSLEALTTIAATVALFVTYASFRNQSRLAAEANLNVEGHALLELEMGNPKLRCLYDSFGFDNADACLLANMKGPEEWSAAIFYVEESFWLLEKAESDRRGWGSPYSKDIDYWRDYVNDDPTGIFSYYLVSNHGNYDDALLAMRNAAVKIRDLCPKYLRVRQMLVRVKANPPSPIRCP